MKPPATVWVGLYQDGYACVMKSKTEARQNGWFRPNARGKAYRYRLDTKPAAKKPRKRGGRG